MELAHEGIMVDRRSINTRLLEQVLKLRRRWKSLVYTQKMKQARYQWTVAYSKLDITWLVQSKIPDGD